MSPCYLAAAELLADPERWTQGALARDAFGREVPAHSGSAVRWDLLGALERVGATEDDLEPLYEAAGDSLATFNDTFQHRDVLRLLDDVLRDRISQMDDAA